MIHTGDCIEVMATLPADSVDAVVTDPPYGLEFMGKGWDKFGAEVVDAAAQGGFQDGNGGNPFSRSRVRFGAGVGFQQWCTEWGREALRVTKPGGYLLAFGGTRTHHRLVCALEDAGWIIRDELEWIYASGFPKGKANLKPAHEPIVLARKPGPLRPLAIDECRIGTADTRGVASPTTLGVMNDDGWEPKPVVAGSENGRWPSNVLLSDPELFDEPNPYVVGSGATTTVPGTYQSKPLNKWAPTSYPGSPPGDIVEGYGDSGGYSRFFIVPKSARAEREPVLRGQLEAVRGGSMEGGADTRTGNPVQGPARENAHPTVKPVDLMRHLVRLVTPVGGTVLDPFLGSGTTAIACELEGFPWVGIEKEPEYVAIAEARLNGTQRGLGLDVPAPVQKRGRLKDGHIGGNGLGEHFGDVIRNRMRPTDEEPAA